MTSDAVPSSSRFLRTGTFAYAVHARSSREAAVALLGDLTRQGELHPLIIEVKPVVPLQGAMAGFAITDRLAFGPFRFRITYRADVLSLSNSRIVTVAHQNPATTVLNTTELSDEHDGVRIDVSITLTAPKPLFRYAFRQAETAHRELGRRIAATLDRGPDRPDGAAPEPATD